MKNAAERLTKLEKKIDILFEYLCEYMPHLDKYNNIIRLRDQFRMVEEPKQEKLVPLKHCWDCNNYSRDHSNGKCILQEKRFVYPIGRMSEVEKYQITCNDWKRRKLNGRLLRPARRD